MLYFKNKFPSWQVLCNLSYLNHHIRHFSKYNLLPVGKSVMYSDNRNLAGRLTLASPKDPPIPAFWVSVSTNFTTINLYSSSELIIAAVHPSPISEIQKDVWSTNKWCTLQIRIYNYNLDTCLWIRKKSCTKWYNLFTFIYDKMI